MPERAGTWRPVRGRREVAETLGRWPPAGTPRPGDRTECPRTIGTLAWIGTADFESPVYGETWGSGRFFGMTPVEPGRTNWYATVPEATTVEELRASFAGWHDPVPRILDADALSRALAAAPPGPAGIEGALRAYDRERRRSAQRTALGSRTLHRFMSTERTRLRDAAVRLLPS